MRKRDWVYLGLGVVALVLLKNRTAAMHGLGFVRTTAAQRRDFRVLARQQCGSNADLFVHPDGVSMICLPKCQVQRPAYGMYQRYDPDDYTAIRNIRTGECVQTIKTDVVGY